MIVRANPSYELVVFDRLPEPMRESLHALRDDPSFYGILRPRDGTLPVKSVDRETALLFLTMREPGELPSYATRTQPDLAARLVFDGILELQLHGTFHTGAADLGGATFRTANTRIARLSRNALEYANALPIDDANALAARLYAYNTVPCTRVPKLDALTHARGWQQTATHGYWRAWTRGAETQATHKLYISPTLDALLDHFPRIVAALSETRATQFKTGADAHGLLRPDKLVAYYASFDELAEAAAHLETALRGIPAQGVPFTSEIGGDGLLSWGADPPRRSESSWRHWLVHRLARALITARDVDAALQRVALDGVDVERWIPSATIWQEHA
ncbi:MAG TPA: hypothetical protein VFN10_04650 [Thermoanaerobaculia bacterium]|nr:hypothetical protein [Thermoanaerobaculia bacterium]